MSMNHTRKPSAASETFITTLAVLFFIGVALLFQFLDSRKNGQGNSQKSDQSTEKPKEQISSAKEINSLPPFIGNSTTKIAGNVQSRNSSKIKNSLTARAINFISPPLPLLDIPKQIITVDAGGGQVFT